MKKRIINYVSYKIIGFHKNDTPIIVDVTTLSNTKKLDLINDACSLHGINNVRVSETKSRRKDAIIITPEKHYTYDWENLSKEYYDKCFNPEKF